MYQNATTVCTVRELVLPELDKRNHSGTFIPIQGVNSRLQSHSCLQPRSDSFILPTLCSKQLVL